MPTPTPPSNRDQSRGLTLFGAVLISLGTGIMVAAVAARPGAPDARTAVWTLLGAGVTGTALIWLGIGSVLARRWAAALLLCFGVIHLFLGLLSVPGFVIMMAASPALGYLGFLYGIGVRVVLPIALVAFYVQPEVRRTCEARDPVVPWTSRCPLPVLGCCLLLGELALQAVSNGGVGAPLPIAGYVVGGLAAQGLWFAVALFTGYSAWGIFRGARRVWLGYAVFFALFSLSSIITLARHRIQVDTFEPEFSAAAWAAIAAVLTGAGSLVYARFSFGPRPELE